MMKQIKIFFYMIFKRSIYFRANNINDIHLHKLKIFMDAVLFMKIETKKGDLHFSEIQRRVCDRLNIQYNDKERRFITDLFLMNYDPKKYDHIVRRLNIDTNNLIKFV